MALPVKNSVASSDFFFLASAATRLVAAIKSNASAFIETILIMGARGEHGESTSTARFFFAALNVAQEVLRLVDGGAPQEQGDVILHRAEDRVFVVEGGK